MENMYRKIAFVVHLYYLFAKSKKNSQYFHFRLQNYFILQYFNYLANICGIVLTPYITIVRLYIDLVVCVCVCVCVCVRAQLFGIQ